MSQSEILKGEVRERVGSNGARKLRRAGRIPASLQAPGSDLHVDFSIDEEAFVASRRHHTHLYDIEIGELRESAVVHELQWDTFGERMLHVEFQRVSRFEKVETEVPLLLLGHPKGGIVSQALHAVEVACLPTDIPDQIEVKVEGLAVGTVIHASDLVLPPGVELALPGETILITIVEPPREAPAAAAAEGAAPEAGPAAGAETKAPE